MGSSFGSSDFHLMTLAHKIAGKADLFKLCQTGQDFLTVLKDKKPMVKTKSELENVISAKKSFLNSHPNVDKEDVLCGFR